MAVAQLAALRTQSDTEQKQYEDELRELGQAQAADQALLQVRLLRTFFLSVCHAKLDT